MHADRYIKVVLTLIAIGLWALTMTQLQTAEVQAAPKPPVEAIINGQESQVSPSFTPTRIGPLRWRIGYAAELNTDFGGVKECHTSISFLNTAPTSTKIEVVFFDDLGLGTGDKIFTLPANDSHAFSTRTLGKIADMAPFPAADGALIATGGFMAGFALVWADDPRVLVSAFLVCNQDATLGGNYPYSGMSNIPAFPVGATAQYFQAGMPAAWTPPMVEPEVPE